MPEFIGGLPVHPLLVHFTVVLIALSVAGAVLSAVWPAVRRRFGWLVFAGSALGTVLVPFTTKSGENLAGRLPGSPQINEHERLADLMIWWALGLTVAVGVLMVVHTMAERTVTSKVAVGAAGAEEEVPQEAGRAPALVAIVLALITVGVAVGAGIHVYRVGDAGARAVWEGVENLPAQNGG
ncbi:DUF2231 domain-containing protein [Actinophytocola sp.]|uniref:DUF2231 domain-containing protein n=1 Tax=Actinophytocola sp. TaxID=1872138 RepID=UPI002D38FFC1|nr:DUF2231 domain-containing protein [Actinophytocola sp.]HYQ63699.1 DUF2231 domain-containing protein [Actinophytocola sp.]